MKSNELLLKVSAPTCFAQPIAYKVKPLLYSCLFVRLTCALLHNNALEALFLFVLLFVSSAAKRAGSMGQPASQPVGFYSGQLACLSAT